MLSGDLSLQPDQPKLLRLGWALNDEHSSTVPFQVTEDIRMSNPCHAMTSAFAAALLERFETIDTTVDVYTHRNAPEAGEALTIMPPIASDLSWSTGALPSLIHPKDVHSNFLRGKGLEQEAKENDLKIERHVKHIFHRQFLVVGHPRTGTGFTAATMKQNGAGYWA